MYLLILPYNMELPYATQHHVRIKVLKNFYAFVMTNRHNCCTGVVQ